MKYLLTILITILFVSGANAGGIPVTYNVDGVSYEGYFIKKKATAPLVLLVHDWDGLTDYEVRRAKMLADLGYTVFAADLFGAGVRPSATEDKRKMTRALYNDREKMRRLLTSALKAAQSKAADTANAVAVGYCFGGTAVLELARSGADLKGFVSFHGGLETPSGQNYSKTKGHVLVLHGTADSSVSMEDFAMLASELEDAGVSHEMITYSGAPHAFTVFGSERYRKEADQKSWHRFTDFLVATLVAR